MAPKYIKSIIKYTILASLGLILFLNIINTLTSTDPFVQAKKQMWSLSKGDRYYAKLKLWYLYAQKGDWIHADKVGSKLDIKDLAFYKSNHDPREIQKTITSLINQKDKTIDDWIHLAQLQLILNQKKEALNSLDQACQLDPIRDDLNKLRCQLSD